MIPKTFVVFQMSFKFTAFFMWTHCNTHNSQHNDANVLALGGRTTGIEVAKDIVHTYISTSFAGAHHSARIAKLTTAYCACGAAPAAASAATGL
jgi:hypothetical protein